MRFFFLNVKIFPPVDSISAGSCRTLLKCHPNILLAFG